MNVVFVLLPAPLRTVVLSGGASQATRMDSTRLLWMNEWYSLILVHARNKVNFALVELFGNFSEFVESNHSKVVFLEGRE